jgi:hypothetical protein
MNSTDTILEFLIFLADVQTIFRQVQLSVEKSPALQDVSTFVIPSKGDPSPYAQGGVLISIALNAELRKPLNADRKAIGMSLLLRHTGGSWLAEAEVGWSGESIGWDQFDARDDSAVSVEEIMTKAKTLVVWMGTRFKEEVAKLPS